MHKSKNTHKHKSPEISGLFYFQKESMKEKITVAIQGALGAFHEEAAKRYFKNQKIEILACDTFPEVIKAVENKTATHGIMAIENTVAGSILPNYALIQEAELKITGEYYMRIVQNLMALPGTKIEELSEVYSHPMAIYQSRKFFRKYLNISLIEAVDTAISANDVRKFGKKKRGAIASVAAAERNNLQILAHGIEDDKKNYTRFFILKTKKSSLKNDVKIDKASACFSLKHKTGSLSAALSIFAFYGINLFKIQSHPIIGQPGEYLFHVDLVFDDYEMYLSCLSAIKPLTRNIQILGEYKAGYQSYLDIHA